MLVYVASYMSHRAFWQCSLDALYRGATEDFCSAFSYSWEGFETNRGLRWCFLLPGRDKGVSLKVLFCSCFFFMFLDALYRSTCVFCRVLWIFLEVSLEKLWSVRVFFCSVPEMLRTGEQHGFFAGSCRYSWEGFETNPGLGWCFLLPGSRPW